MTEIVRGPYQSCWIYHMRGYRITSVHTGAIDKARHIKSSLSLIGDYGIEIHDEMELEKSFGGGMATFSKAQL
ncbi:hypothetical protein [Alicyclobacillus sp. ALC3]|uniref:hypothetical protein n=1 Tax=Alicyclobacillus sp. ALC3 TaxID=2796143 RepID=UPI00237988A0|nr:hypothetical protein [Alicyclobacillus sp. ALC3]WDL96456.1 hypothetical protein JC200_19370 [Alicyclobacillus sp. ALC3]